MMDEMTDVTNEESEAMNEALDDAAGAAAGDDAASRIAALEAALETAKQESLYAMADTQNVRRRLEKELQDARAYAATRNGSSA